MAMVLTLFFRRKSNTYLEPRYATNKHLRCFLTACKRFLQKNLPSQVTHRVLNTLLIVQLILALALS